MTCKVLMTGIAAALFVFSGCSESSASISSQTKRSETLVKEANVLLQQKKYTAAQKKVKEAVKLGDARAIFLYGMMYTRGDGVEKDYSKAMEYFKMAYKHGYVNAAYDIGVMYRNGEGVKPDREKAKHYYRIAAKNNYPLAQAELAKIYAEEKNRKMYEYWAKRAIANGYGRR